MTSTEQRIRELFDRHTSGSLDNAGRQELFGLLNEHPHVLSGLGKDLQLDDYPQKHSLDTESQALILETIFAIEPGAPSLQEAPVKSVPRVHFLRKWGWAAASIILIASVSTAILLSSDRQQRNRGTMEEPVANIQPGREGAVLTLADGTQVLLDSMGNGVVAVQNGAQVLLEGGNVTYTPSGSADGEIVYNIMSTPKGRQFRLTLPDGTQVWLNSASSLRYPTVFTGKERSVRVTGEAYFEVAKNADMPFRVNLNDKAEVEVLGTHFNVNAYDNEESIATTLLEGSVRTGPLHSSSPDRITLKPGQQALIPGARQARQNIRVVNDPDLEKVMAWKNGLFDFEGAQLQEVMRQLERWYNIEVVYEKGVPDIGLIGKMTKDVPLNGLLKNLEDLGVHYRLEGRILTILPAAKN